MSDSKYNIIVNLGIMSHGDEEGDRLYYAYKFIKTILPTPITPVGVPFVDSEGVHSSIYLDGVVASMNKKHFVGINQMGDPCTFVTYGIKKIDNCMRELIDMGWQFTHETVDD